MNQETVVAVLGASPKPERYSNKAIRELTAKGYAVIPINPAKTEIESLKVLANLSLLEPGSVDTVSMYVGAKISSGLDSELLALKPRRVIFNPGSENEFLENVLRENSIEVVEGCTLVMLRLGSF